MKKARKVLSLVLAVLMLCSCFVVADVRGATFNDINQSGVFVKQQTNYTCTLAAAVMLVRRTAMAAGNNNWGSITESAMRGTAWLEGSGLYYNFTYAGVSVGHASISGDVRLAYINLLNKYPQGVVAYNPGWNNQSHAVLLTDYDGKTDTFYCSDPANGAANGRIPLTSSSIKGQGANGQNDKLSVLTEYWYVKSPSITLTSNEPTTIIYPTDGAIYKIASAVGSDKYLDFALSSNNVQIHESCDNYNDPAFVKSQYFKLFHRGDGWYQIINIGNNFAVDVAGANPASGTNIWQWEPIVYDAQLFRFYDAGNGYCYIKSKLGCYVDVAYEINENGANVWAHEFMGSIAQKWKLQSHSHSYSSKITTAATCTKTGVKTFNCRCGASYTETISKTSHNSNTTIPAVASTCTKTGLTEGKKCSVCGTVTVAQQTVAMKTHNSNTIIPAVAPTCRETGLTEGKKCSVCGTVTVAQQIIDKVDCVNNDGDDMCDYCEKDMPTNEPDATDCSCNCHKGGISGLIFKIILFFQRIFGMNKECKCGIAHY